MPQLPEQPKRIVIYRLGSLGDTIVALPAFQRIAQTWPAAERIALTNVPVASNAAPLDIILRGGKIISSVIEYPVGTRSVKALWRLARRLRGLESEVLVYLTAPRGRLNALRDWTYFKLCGFKHVIGVPLTNDLQKCREADAAVTANPADTERECERLVRCVAALGPVNLDDPAMWDLHLTPQELEVGDALTTPLARGGFFAINMGGKAKQKDWGLDNWSTLLSMLTRRYPGAGLLVVGAAEDSARARTISSRWQGTVVDACGQCNPRESAAAMRSAIAFIGHDSGPLHLAAAAGVPCIGLFGDYNKPRRWHPYGERHRMIHKMQGLASISVDEVLGAVDSVAPTRSDAA